MTFWYFLCFPDAAGEYGLCIGATGIEAFPRPLVGHILHRSPKVHLQGLLWLSFDRPFSFCTCHANCQVNDTALSGLTEEQSSWFGIWSIHVQLDNNTFRTLRRRTFLLDLGLDCSLKHQMCFDRFHPRLPSPPPPPVPDPEASQPSPPPTPPTPPLETKETKSTQSTQSTQISEMSEMETQSSQYLSDVSELFYRFFCFDFFQLAFHFDLSCVGGLKWWYVLGSPEPQVGHGDEASAKAWSLGGGAHGGASKRCRWSERNSNRQYGSMGTGK